MIILAVCFCPLYGWYDPFIKERVVSSKTIGLQRVIQGPIMLKCNKIQRLVVRKVTSLTVIQVLYICDFPWENRGKGDYTCNDMAFMAF